MLRAHGIRRGTIVDAGCGSGVLAEQLVDAGYHVVGFDISAAMVRMARARVPRARFRRGSLTTVRLPRAGAVIALNEVVNYVGGVAALGPFFTRAYRALRPGGLLIFDFIASAARRTYAGKSRSGRDWAIAVRAEASRSGRVLTRYITTFRKVAPREYRKTFETHRVSILDRDRVARHLAGLGFRVTMRRSYGRLRLMAGDYAVIAEKPLGSS